jgi:methionyl-tRNA formyltransferase
MGQQDFGRAVMEAFIARGDEVVGVFCKPEKAGERPDALRASAQSLGLQVFQFDSLKGLQAEAAMRSLNADIGVMAYVLQFVPQSLVNIPTHGTIQYHPSLLPRYRGPSSINWPIARGETETGLSVFRPTDGLDEGPVILQKRCPIGPDDTLGDVYFNRLFPMGVQAMIEAADLVVHNRHFETPQDEQLAHYEGWFKAEAAEIHWSQHVHQVYNLIRASNPAPGAWTDALGPRVWIYDCRKHISPRFTGAAAKPGSVSHVSNDTLFIHAQGGMIEVLRLKPEGGSKMNAGLFAKLHLGLDPQH